MDYAKLHCVANSFIKKKKKKRPNTQIVLCQFDENCSPKTIKQVYFLVMQPLNIYRSVSPTASACLFSLDS